MGLSAIVYKSLLSVEKEFPGGRFTRDPETGECEVVSLSDLDPLFDPVAEDRHFGSISHIAYLSDVVAERLGESSSLDRLVLYPGGRVGDTGGWAGGAVDENSFAALLAELKVILSNPAPYVEAFAEDLLSLIEAARRENNPILLA